jgi:hypothetical protein
MTTKRPVPTKKTTPIKSAVLSNNCQTTATVSAATTTKRIAELENKVDTLIWLHTELVLKARMAAAQQVMQNPQFQDKIRAALVAQMNSAQTPNGPQ